MNPIDDALHCDSLAGWASEGQGQGLFDMVRPFIESDLCDSLDQALTGVTGLIVRLRHRADHALALKLTEDTLLFEADVQDQLMTVRSPCWPVDAMVAAGGALRREACRIRSGKNYDEERKDKMPLARLLPN